jgi:chemotaxis protein MotB
MRTVSFIGSVSGLAVFTLSVGCVSTGKYDALEEDRAALEQRNGELVLEVGVLAAKNAELVEQLSDSMDENRAMRGTYDQLLVELEAEVAGGQIEIQELIDGIQLNVSNQLLFASGSASLNESGVEVIRRVAAKIRDERATIDVEGHTDTDQIGRSLRSRYPTNWELAGARASRVVREFSENGVPPTRLRAVSRGPFDPIATNETAEGRAENRRTEVVLRPLP